MHSFLHKPADNDKMASSLLSWPHLFISKIRNTYKEHDKTIGLYKSSKVTVWLQEPVAGHMPLTPAQSEYNTVNLKIVTVLIG